MRGELRRRGVLAAGATAVPLLAAGCKGVGALGTPPRPLPQVGVLRAAISAEEALITRYRSAIAGSPPLAATLTPVLGQHLAHLAALRSRLIEPAGTPVTPGPADPGAGPPRGPATPAPTEPATTAPGRPATPGPADQAATLAALAADESAAAAALTGRLARVSPSLAQLLASVAASEASHAALLRAHRSPG